jgi:hypothetical protein
MHYFEILHRIRPNILPFIAVLFSIIALVAFWGIVPGGSFNQNENRDYVNYYLPVAQNIVHGQGVTLHGKTALNYPVGFPLIVAANLTIAKLTGLNEELIIKISVLFFFSFGALLIFFIARKIWSPWGALLASALWSCYPIVLWAAKNPNTELPFSVAFYSCLLCLLTGWLVSKRSLLFFFIGGAFIGIAMLIRPIAIGLGIFLVVLVFIGRRHSLRKKIVLALCLTAGNMLTVLPWELWVYSKTHAIVPLCRGQQPFSLMDGLTFAVWNPDPAAHRRGVKVPPDVKELMNYLVREHAYKIQSEALSSQEIMRIMFEESRKRPTTVAKLAVIKAARSWYGTNSNRLESLILAFQIAYVSLLSWAVFLFWRRRPEYRFVLTAGMATMVYFWGMATLVLSIVRYMMPVLGVLIIFFPAIPLFLLRRRPEKTVNAINHSIAAS